MYTVYAINHFENTIFEQNYLEWELAYNIFKVAMSCVDCARTCILNATTGELLIEWESK